ncbi:MAG: Fpg/Nei family DNA glycosylase [Mycobacteriaceae bacterium]|nr:Fpg/Nei family DNA glycosylase [Mycobacteriaceae bacterium]
MPEGDTVFRAAARLRPALVGRTLTVTDFRVPRFATVDLRGQAVDEITTYGKHLFFHIGAVSVHTHLKMEGVWHVYTQGARWRRPAHTVRLILATSESQVVGFSLGVVEALPLESEHTVTDHLGPDLLGPNWDPAEATRRLASQPDRPIGLALLDQRNLAGIGNIYRSEICFLRRVNPKTPVGRIDDLPALVDEAHRVLTKAAHEPPWRPMAYDRQRRPCRRCGAGIVVHLLADDEPTRAERGVYFCPRCQPTLQNDS